MLGRVSQDDGCRPRKRMSFGSGEVDVVHAYFSLHMHMQGQLGLPLGNPDPDSSGTASTWSMSLPCVVRRPRRAVCVAPRSGRGGVHTTTTLTPLVGLSTLPNPATGKPSHGAQKTKGTGKVSRSHPSAHAFPQSQSPLHLHCSFLSSGFWGSPLLDLVPQFDFSESRVWITWEANTRTIPQHVCFGLTFSLQLCIGFCCAKAKASVYNMCECVCVNRMQFFSEECFVRIL